MLLDQKRTKRFVRVGAIIATAGVVAIAGIVIAMAIFGVGGSSSGQQIKDARHLVEQQPTSPVAWDRLASAYRADGQTDKAIEAAQKAVSLAPHEFTRTLTLVKLFSDAGRPGQAIDAVQDYTRRNPQDAEGFLQLGYQAENNGRKALALLSYQRFLTLDPQNTSAEAVRKRMKALGAPA